MPVMDGCGNKKSLG